MKQTDPTLSTDSNVTIFGAGPAGLACGWAMEEAGNKNYSIFEKSSVHGGNARTIKSGEFLYDTGPHRFHASDVEATRRISELMGTNLHSVEAPARIWWQGRFVDFPLRPLQILKNGGLPYTIRAAKDLVLSRFRSNKDESPEDFAEYAQSRFGDTIAKTFLIPFSERLWGLPASELSPDIAGRRLPGFSIPGLIKEALLRSKKSDHLEGRFLYPKLGYGEISDRMANQISHDKLHYNHRIEGIGTEDNRISTVSVNTGMGSHKITPAAVINTLPITSIVNMMNPKPPEEVLTAAAQLKFRDVVLVAIFLDQHSISDAAVTYFQGPQYEFSRAHEPRNRSLDMSPQGKTSLVVEFPCFNGDDIWNRDSDTLATGLIRQLDQMGLIDASLVSRYDTHRLENAYPVYFKGYETISEIVLSYLRRFENFWTLGRGGSYFYGHLHDFVSDGFEIANSVINANIGKTKPVHEPTSL